MIVVSDTSPISSLLQIGQIELLRHLYTTVTIPVEVNRELSVLPEQTAALQKLDWIIVAKATQVTLVNELRQQVDPGEAEAIALALELNAHALIIDERRGRELARAYGVERVGVLGILVQAKQKGYLERVTPEIHKLQAIGFRMHDRLIDRIRKEVNE